MFCLHIQMLKLSKSEQVANSTVTSLGERTRGGSPVQTNAHRDWPRSDTPQDSRPVRKPANATPESSGVSFHCRSCLRDPCVEPVATVCGHLFCHRYALRRVSVVSISGIRVGVTDFWCAVHCLSLAPQVYRTGALDEDVLSGLSEGVLCPTAC